MAAGFGRDSKGSFSDQSFQQESEQKQQTLIDGFALLSDSEKMRAIQAAGSDNVFNRFGTMAERFEAGARDISLFQVERDAELTSNMLPRQQAALKKMVKTLSTQVADVKTPFAAAIRSLNAGNTIEAVSQHYFTQESAHQSAQQVIPLWTNVIVPSFVTLSGSGDVDALVTASSNWMLSSPAYSYNSQALISYLRALMQNDPQQLVVAVDALQWLPLNDDVHRQLSRFVQREYGSWRGRIQKDANSRKSSTKEASQQIAALFPQLNTGFQRLSNKKEINLLKAPNEFAANWAKILQAVGRDDQRLAAQELEAFAQSITQNQDFKNEPFFGAYVESIFKLNRLKGEAYSGQIALLKAVLNDAPVDNDNAFSLQKYFIDQMATSRRDWPNKIPSGDQSLALQLNEVIGQTLLQQGQTSGQVDAQLLDYFFDMRSGRGWNDVSSGQEVMTSLLRDGAIFSSGYQRSGYRSTVPTIMAVTRKEFPALSDQFPVETWFDKAYIAEAERTGIYDAKYWEFGRDESGIIRQAASKVFGSVDHVARSKQSDTALWMNKIFVEGLQTLQSSDMSDVDLLEQGFEQRQDDWSAGRAYFKRVTAFGTGATSQDAYRNKLRQFVARTKFTRIGRRSFPRCIWRSVK